MTKKDENKHKIIYFLMSIAKEQKDKNKYLELHKRFEDILPEEKYEDSEVKDE